MSDCEQCPPAELTWLPADSEYAQLWRGCEWQPFLWATPGGSFPNEPGQKVAVRTLQRPGVYEIGISSGFDSLKVHKVYVGKASNVRTEHLQYAKSGGQLSALMAEALRRGNIIWRRIRFVESESRAAQMALRCRSLLDYPWSIEDKGSGSSRVVFLSRKPLMCGLSSATELVCRDDTGQTHSVRV